MHGSLPMLGRTIRTSELSWFACFSSPATDLGTGDGIGYFV